LPPDGTRPPRPRARPGNATEARRAPSEPPPGRPLFSCPRHVEDVGEDAAVDADGGAGQRQELGPIGIERALHLLRLEPAEDRQGGGEQAQPAFPKAPHQVARPQLASGVQLIDQPLLHHFLLALAAGAGRGFADGDLGFVDRRGQHLVQDGDVQAETLARPWRSARPTQR